MKAIERHLYIRNGYYYFRKAFPRNLHFLLPYKEIWIGLNTQDLSAARVQSAQLDYEISQPLRSLQKALINLSPEQSPDMAVHNFLTAISTARDSYGYEPPAKY